MNAIELPPCLPQELLRLEVPEGDDAVRRAADQELVGLGDVEVEHGGVLVALQRGDCRRCRREMGRFCFSLLAFLVSLGRIRRWAMNTTCLL